MLYPLTSINLLVGLVDFSRVLAYSLLSLIALMLLSFIASYFLTRRLQKKAFKLSSFLAYEVLVKEFMAQDKTPENIEAFEVKKQRLDIFNWKLLPALPPEGMDYILIFPSKLRKSVLTGEYDAVLAYTSFMLDFINQK